MAWSYTVSGVVHGTVGQSLRGAPSPKRASFFDTLFIFGTITYSMNFGGYSQVLGRYSAGLFAVFGE